MPFALPFGLLRRRPPEEHWLRVGAQPVRLHLVPSRRARRYVLRLRPDGTARVAIPRRGSAAGAKLFAERNIPWLERQLLKQAARPARPRNWTMGTEFLFRGDAVRLAGGPGGDNGTVRFGGEEMRIKDAASDLRPEVERHLRRLAALELPSRVSELAAFHGVTVQRVTVRNQRSRWGSCSRRGTISLNWRLLQTPTWVRDYIILHELAHLVEMNHTDRFWSKVEQLCPEFAQAERWLKAHTHLFE